MVQGSTAWLEWRKLGIGSSDAPAIMGKCPYRKRADVLAEKLGQGKPVKTNPAMELGTKWESAARALHYFETDVDLLPAEIVHPEFSWLRASLDGYLEKIMFIEIKFMGEKNFDLVKSTERPLGHHWVQMQHQFLVTGLTNGVYAPYTLSEDRRRIERIQYLPVKADEAYMTGDLFSELQIFWQEVLLKRSLLEVSNGQHCHPHVIGQDKGISGSVS